MGERRFSTKNRFVSFLLAIAMVLTLLPIGAVQAKAEEAAVKLYFELPEGTEYKCWNSEIAKGGYKAAYYVPTENKWYTGADKSTEIKKATVRDIYVISGDTALTGFDWGFHDENSLTKDGNKYSITFANVSAGTYSYKILQDPEVEESDTPFLPIGSEVHRGSVHWLQRCCAKEPMLRDESGSAVFQRPLLLLADYPDPSPHRQDSRKKYNNLILLPFSDLIHCISPEAAGKI